MSIVSVAIVSVSRQSRGVQKRLETVLSYVYTRATCCPDEQLVSRDIYIDGQYMLPSNKLLVRDTY